MAERGARGIRSHGRREASPPEADVRRTVLEFDFLSRMIAATQSMTCQPGEVTIAGLLYSARNDGWAPSYSNTARGKYIVTTQLGTSTIEEMRRSPQTLHSI